MTLITRVFELCESLGDDWADLLKQHGLNIRKRSWRALEAELLKTELHVDRRIPGFADFADDVAHGIVACQPARSLLYHALASPNVVTAANGEPLKSFPTLEEIEVVENYCFGVEPRKLSEISAEHGDLSVVVFAYEYRSASQTPHGKHADLVFSRTGIARVGTRGACYRHELRGFLPESGDDPYAIHVSPARYGAFLAVQKTGNKAAFLPMRFRDKEDEPKEDAPAGWVPDDQRDFWIPVHKLFPGDECLLGANGKALPLTVTFTGSHINEKLFRLHRLLKLKPSAGYPYRITSGLADVITSPHGSAMVVPIPRPLLIEEARHSDGRPVTFKVPKMAGGSAKDDEFDVLATSLEYNGVDGPAYVHVRTEIRDGKSIDLNQDDPALHTDTALFSKIQRGGYNALNYVDFTGDGAVEVQCPALDGHSKIRGAPRAAYSLIAAPDFYPACDQRGLTEWTGSIAVPKDLRDSIWNRRPDTLCDVRLPPNLQLPGKQFTTQNLEPTVTAIVSMPGNVPCGAAVDTAASPRHTHLPDDAAGIFAPGWDVSTSEYEGVEHLAAFRLGSPFPEDGKLCAALSTFWPAVAPDATREMEPYPKFIEESGTVSPMTDAEIGQVGNIPWDGVRGPQVVVEDGQEFVEYVNFNRVDYVRNALNGLFTMRLTARVNATEYQRRVLAMAYAYQVLHRERTGKKLPAAGLPTERKLWKLLSFQPLAQGHPELTRAEDEAQVVLRGSVYQCVIYLGERVKVQDAPDFRKKRILLTNKCFLLIDPSNRLVILRKESESRWRKGLL